MIAPLRPTNQPTPPTPPPLLLDGTSSEQRRNFSATSIFMAYGFGRQHLWVDLPSKWGLTKAMLNKSRIGINLIWLQVVFIAQQKACSLKKVENYHSTMKKKTCQPASGMRCSCQLKSSQFIYVIQILNVKPPDNSGSTGKHNHWTNPLLQVSPAMASAGPSEDRDRPGDANKGWSYQRKTGAPYTLNVLARNVRMIDKIIPPAIS